jgi:hypothetical protein
MAKRRGRAELFDALRQDVVYAARSLRRAPLVSITIILTLALGNLCTGPTEGVERAL